MSIMESMEGLRKALDKFDAEERKMRGEPPKAKEPGPVEHMVKEHKGVKHGDNVNLDVLALTQVIEFMREAKKGMDDMTSGLSRGDATDLWAVSDHIQSSLDLIECMFDSWADNNLDANLKTLVNHINNHVDQVLFKPHLVRACKLTQRIAYGEFNVPVKEWQAGLTQEERDV